MVNNHYRWDFIGLSTDTKPTPETSEKVVNGSTFYCSDTSKLYVFYKDTWYERQPLGGGGGGGTTYTAGDGIDITNNTISVDTTTIQPKLTAGSNITISDENVISASGGGSITPVQTTGTSTTDVMSQNATTSLVFSDPDNRTKIQIGASSYAGANEVVTIGQGATTYGARAIAIGRNANASFKGSIALGTGSSPTVSGQVDIGCAASPSYGYGGNSSYRLLSGVHDGQGANDAVTVAQVNATIDAINTALSTNIPHIGATS